MAESIFDAYDSDVKAEEEGKEIELRNGAFFRIRSENSVKVRDFIAKMVRKQRHEIFRHGGSLPAELQDKNDIEICAEVLIVGWRNVRGRDGNEIPYSKKLARELVTALPALRRELMLQSRIDETFRQQSVEELAGNSAAPSESDGVAVDN